jgi:hypothetical protein
MKHSAAVLYQISNNPKRDVGDNCQARNGLLCLRNTVVLATCAPSYLRGHASILRGKTTRNCHEEMSCLADQEANRKHVARYVYTARSTVLFRMLLDMGADSR